MRLFHGIGRSKSRGGGLHLFAKLLGYINMIVFSNAVSIEASIGESTEFKHHGIGCVVHAETVIGDNCIIFQNVTIGCKFTDGVSNGKAPKIGNNVMVGAGAVILGDIVIGDNSIIGANAVVIQDVPCNSLAIGVPARIIRRNTQIEFD